MKPYGCGGRWSFGGVALGRSTDSSGASWDLDRSFFFLKTHVKEILLRVDFAKGFLFTKRSIANTMKRNETFQKSTMVYIICENQLGMVENNFCCSTKRWRSTWSLRLLEGRQWSAPFARGRAGQAAQLGDGSLWPPGVFWQFWLIEYAMFFSVVRCFIWSCSPNI